MPSKHLSNVVSGGRVPPEVHTPQLIADSGDDCTCTDVSRRIVAKAAIDISLCLTVEVIECGVTKQRSDNLRKLVYWRLLLADNDVRMMSRGAIADTNKTGLMFLYLRHRSVKAVVARDTITRGRV